MDDFLFGIRNIIKWFKIIWNDSSLDSYYLYKIMHKKLSIMYDYLSGDTLTFQPGLKRLRVCKELAKRICEDDYLQRALMPYFTRYGTDFSRDNQEKEKLFDKCSYHSIYMAQQDLDMLHNLMAKYSQGWWD